VRSSKRRVINSLQGVEGRIKEKGEILDILYQDHIASKQKRQLKELMYAAEVEGLLGRKNNS
jgi:hypothetical protein